MGHWNILAERKTRMEQEASTNDWSSNKKFAGNVAMQITNFVSKDWAHLFSRS